jgi:predicted ATP-dependent serine protease
VKQRLDDSISGKRYSVEWRWPQIDDLTNALLPATQTLICGEPGSSKSFMALQTAAYWHERGVKVSILETEETLAYHMERLLAQRTGLKGLIKPAWCKEHPAETLQAWENNQDFLDSFGSRVTDNCRKFITHAGSIAWCKEQAASGSRILIIDPVTALDRGKGEIHDLDKDYIHKMQAVIDEYQCSVIMVTHPTKEFERPSLAKISGGASFEQFTQTVIWLYAIPKDQAKVSYVQVEGGLHTEIAHDRELWILKARNGCGTGLKLAANFEDNLRLKVEGVICAKPKG